MTSNAEKTRLIFQTIGWPIGSGRQLPETEQLEEITEYAFKSRVGLLFLDECIKRGVALGPKALELHSSLMRRRKETDRVVVKLARRLDEIAKGEWVLFKSIKPFASTPNDTDWFPFDPKRHKELIEHLISKGGGFKWMEEAPLQTTLIEEGGVGVTDTTKKGGIYYIDCYVAPSTDYFIYLDTRSMRGYTKHIQIGGYSIPVLLPHWELAAIMFHNVFPEKSFNIESYYLIKCYLNMMETSGTLEAFVDACYDQKMEFACAINLTATRLVDKVQFGITDPRIAELLQVLGYPDLDLKGFNPAGEFPYEFTAMVFFKAFLFKQRELTSFKSTINQFLHMLNPFFFIDVVKTIWRRTVRGRVYVQN